MNEPDFELGVGKGGQEADAPPAQPETTPDTEQPAPAAAEPVNAEQAQMDGYRMSPEELRALQDAQAEHAFNIQAEDLARRFPVVRELRERLAKAEAKASKRKQ